METRGGNPLKLLLLVVRRGDLAVSTRKMTEEAAQVGAGLEWEGQRKEDSGGSSKPSKVVPTGPVQKFGRVGRTVEEVFGGVRGCPAYFEAV